MNKSNQHLNKCLRIRTFACFLFSVIVFDSQCQYNRKTFISADFYKKIILNFDSKKFSYNYKKGLTYRNSKGKIDKINNQFYLLTSDNQDKYLKCNYDSSVSKNDDISIKFTGISKEDMEYHNCGILINNSLVKDCRCDSLKILTYKDELKNIQFYIRGNERTFTRIGDTLHTQIKYPRSFIKNFDILYDGDLFNYEVIKNNIEIKKRKIIFRGETLKSKK